MFQGSGGWGGGGVVFVDFNYFPTFRIHLTIKLSSENKIIAVSQRKQFFSK